MTAEMCPLRSKQLQVKPPPGDGGLELGDALSDRLRPETRSHASDCLIACNGGQAGNLTLQFKCQLGASMLQSDEADL